MKRAVVVCLIILIAGGAFGNYLRYSRQMPERGPDFREIPMEHDGYVADEHRFSEADYDVLQADTSTLRLYRDPVGNQSWLFVAYFSSQKYGSQIHSPKHCLPGGGWRIERHEYVDLPIVNDDTRRVNRLIIGDRGEKQVMFYWFETRGGAITDEFGLKLDLARNSLMLRPTDAAFVRYTIPVEAGDTIDGVTQKATKFLAMFYPDIMRALPFDNP